MVADNQASYDGAEQNSGLLGFTTNGQGQVTGAVITPHARDRYNALVAAYGARYQPAVKPDDGIVPTGTNTFRIDAEHLIKFSAMNRWRKQAQP
jgi:hypothetical protein